MKILLEKIPNYKILGNSEVKITYLGNITEKLYLSRRNKSPTVQRLPNNQMRIIRTGEIINIKPMEKRTDCKNSLRKSMKKLRNLINTNVTDVSKCRWVTLTYKENMTDTKRLYNDYDKFIKRMRYKYGKFEYIVAMEPQGRGAWHAHIVLIFEGKAPFIANKQLKDIWGHGFVKITKLDDVDNVGAYLTAYLGDMEIDDAKKNKVEIEGLALKRIELEKKGKKESKLIVKGARLNMYPANFNLYRSSRGIKKPIEEYMTENEANKKVRAGTLTFSTTHKYTSEDGYEVIIDRKYYNTKRKIKQPQEIEEKILYDHEEKNIQRRMNFTDEVRYAKERLKGKEWKYNKNEEGKRDVWIKNYSELTGEIYQTPFD